MRRTQLHHEHLFVLSDVHGAGDHQVLAVGALTLRPGVRDRAVLRTASNPRRPDRGRAPLPHRRGHAGTPRLGPMTARICEGSDSRSVLLGRGGRPRALRGAGDRRASAEVLGAGVVAASFWSGYADRHGRVAWLRR